MEAAEAEGTRTASKRLVGWVTVEVTQAFWARGVHQARSALPLVLVVWRSCHQVLKSRPMRRLVSSRPQSSRGSNRALEAEWVWSQQARATTRSV